MIKFGVAGNSNSFYAEGYERTVDAAQWCADREIDVFEYSFGRGVNMTEKTAAVIGKAFASSGVELTVHAPYYINFANTDEEMIKKSIGYVLQSAKAVQNLGGNRVVFHPASQGKLERKEAVEICEKNLILLKNAIIDAGFSDLIFCPETMGKNAQIGTVEEIARFAALADFYYPCVDFGHVNARTQGSLKTKEDYDALLRTLFDALPENKVKNMHVHFSKIEYSKGGEVRHLTFEDTVFGPDFKPLAEEFLLYGMEPVVICESDGTQAEDAVRMKRIFEAVSNKQ